MAEKIERMKNGKKKGLLYIEIARALLDLDNTWFTDEIAIADALDVAYANLA